LAYQPKIHVEPYLFTRGGIFSNFLGGYLQIRRRERQLERCERDFIKTAPVFREDTRGAQKEGLFAPQLHFAL